MVATNERPPRTSKCGFSSTRYSYLLCGWRTRSDIPLTCIPPTIQRHCDEEADIVIRVLSGSSPIPKHAGARLFDHSAQRSLIHIADVADFEVSRGRHVHIWPSHGTTQKDIEIILCGPVWATLCHQRSVLPLHASAIKTGEGITAFSGQSGTGKSTTAALMNSLGYPLVADDILAVTFNEDSLPGSWPYLRRLKLKCAPIDELALTPSEPVSDGLDKDKYFVPVRCLADDQWSRLERIYLLEDDPTVPGVFIDRVGSLEAVRILVDQTYHYQFILRTGLFRQHLSLCAQIASKVPVFRLRRSPSFGLRSGLGPLIRSHLEGAPAFECANAVLARVNP